MSESPIFGRIKAAIEAASTPSKPARSVFLGRAEWSALNALCKQWNLDEWPPGGEHYDPEVKRARFLGTEIYRVDANEFLAVI